MPNFNYHRMRSSLFTRPSFKIFVLSTFLLSVATWSAAQKKVGDFVLLAGPTVAKYDAYRVLHHN